MSFPFRTFKVNNSTITEVDSIIPEIDENDNRFQNDLIRQELIKLGYDSFDSFNYGYNYETKEYISDISNQEAIITIIDIFQHSKTDDLLLEFTYFSRNSAITNFYIFSNIYEMSIFVNNLLSNMKSIM